MLSVAVFVSGRGSNLLALFEAIEAGRLDARIVLVLSNKPDAGGLALARARGVPALALAAEHLAAEEELGRHLQTLFARYGADFIVLAGYLKKIPTVIIRQFQQRILNIHPALLPAFGGKGMYGHHVHEAVLAYGCKVSGATVHLVEADYDSGPPVLQQCIPVLEDDTPASLAARVLEVEHQLLPRALQLFAQGRVRISGRRVTILEENVTI
ncbi:MAG TPA: phosphoribosylglycinamide formyltransferase [bacterium]|nr:phosphoribosylglycinamide formyltransferase [bacterium]HPR87452.1 phosphoribosylglycinamide formyltransferase [bacterium]